LLTVEEVRRKAEQARAAGATRFCMGAAWRSPKDGPEFDRVLEMVRAVRALGMEACVTLGMLTDDQARRLKEAGLTAYNHNLDTSRRFYPRVVGTRTFDDRLMMLAELAGLDPPPESVPINCLMPQPGTPLALAPPVDSFELVRLVATA